VDGSTQRLVFEQVVCGTVEVEDQCLDVARRLLYRDAIAEDILVLRPQVGAQKPGCVNLLYLQGLDERALVRDDSEGDLIQVGQ
jgi:hypothetical protein